MMGWIYTGLITLSVTASFMLGQGSQLALAIPQGAQAGINLALSMAGSICLWTGVGRLMEKAGFTRFLSKLLRPLLSRLFPSSTDDLRLSGLISANVCANILGLGNAATPMGIQSARRLATEKNGIASDELCRLVVLNTASIQLIPATVAALRSANGCSTPFDILPAVWLTSLGSAALGLGMAWLLGRVWTDA
jgi:spore maturation protein A